MKITVTSHKKVIITLLVTLMVVVVGYFGLAHHYLKWPFAATPGTSASTDGINYNPPTEDEITTGNNIKSSNDNQASSDNSTTNSDNSSSSTTYMTITDARTVDSNFIISTLIQTITSTATCSLKMSDGIRSYTASVGTQALPNASTCKGFTIPLSELRSGTWTITITLTGPNGLSGSTSKEVKI